MKNHEIKHRGSLSTKLLLGFGALALTAACSSGAVDGPDMLPVSPASVTATESSPTEKLDTPERQAITTPEQYIQSQDIIEGYKYAGDSGLFVAVDQYVVTAYGDTWIQKAENLNDGEIDLQKPHEVIHNNFMLTKPDGTVESMFSPDQFDTNPLSVAPEKIIDGEHKNNFYWPTGMLAQDDEIYVTMQQVISPKQSKDGLDFELVGTDLATFTIKDDTLVFKGLDSLPTRHGDTNATQWGAGYVEYDGYTYIYGSKTANRPYVFGDDYNVARVPSDTPLTDTAKWEYRNAAGWTPHEYSAMPVIPGELGSRSAILPQVSENGTTTFITKEGAVYGTSVIEIGAPTPDAQYSELNTIATVPGYTSEQGASNTSYLAFRSELPNGETVDIISKQGEGDFNLRGYGIQLLENVAL